MKSRILFFVITLGVIASACYRDLGNYDYHPPEEPVVNNLKGETFIAYVGDSLIISPEIKHSLVGTNKLTYQWEIVVGTELRGDYFYGSSLRMLFAYRPAKYAARFTITDETNGMKYFYDFTIDGRTDFSDGAMVLSNQDGASILTFIKPEGDFKTNLYEIINHEPLPSNPLQLELVTYPQPGFDAYWILTGETDNPGVIINPDDLTRSAYVKDKFFVPPTQLHAEHIEGNSVGITAGVYSDKLYIGNGATAPFHSTFGSFGNPISGDYILSPFFAYHFEDYGNQYIVAYEKKKKQFITFSMSPSYSNVSDYSVVRNGTGFDPYYVNMEMVNMMLLNDGTTYAFMKDTTGQIYEFKFHNDVDNFYTDYVRKFVGNYWVNEHTLWQGSSSQIIYFTSNDKIYKYNPISQEIRQLGVNLNGNTITMIYLDESQNELIAGIEGALYYLDISADGNGGVKEIVSGIPGSPVDIVIRK